MQAESADSAGLIRFPIRPATFARSAAHAQYGRTGRVYIYHGCFEPKFRYYARMCAYAIRNSELSAIAPAFTARWLLWTLQTSGEEFSVYIGRPAAQTL